MQADRPRRAGLRQEPSAQEQTLTWSRRWRVIGELLDLLTEIHQLHSTSTSEPLWQKSCQHPLAAELRQDQ